MNDELVELTLGIWCGVVLLGVPAFLTAVCFYELGRRQGRDDTITIMRSKFPDPATIKTEDIDSYTRGQIDAARIVRDEAFRP